MLSKLGSAVADLSLSLSQPHRVPPSPFHLPTSPYKSPTSPTPIPSNFNSNNSKMEIQQSLSGGPSPSSLSAQSPSFTAYSSENLADIAARVVSELNLHHHHDPYDDDFYSSLPNDAVHHKGDAENDDDDDVSEFEFTVLCGGDNSSPISADEIFCNGQIRPVYPLFNTDLLYQNDAVDDPPENPPTPTTIRLPLRRLMREERENGAPSCSSSEADDLEGLPPGTYCVWAPKKKNNSSLNDDVLLRKKSNSTGSNSNSKRWRIRDLLYRSNSDGKDTFVFLTPSQHHHHHSGGNGGDSKRIEKAPAMIARAKKKKSYLPYRQDLIGFFANVNGISRTVRPF